MGKSCFTTISPRGGSLYPQNTGLTDRWLMHMGSLARDIFRPTGTFTVPVTTLAIGGVCQDRGYRFHQAERAGR